MAKKQTKAAKLNQSTKTVVIIDQPEVGVQPKPDGWSDKEWLFVAQYFICKLNGTEAAMQSYKCKDRSVASVVASELLAKPKIRAYVNARLDEYHMAADELLARMAFDARGSMEDFVDPDTNTIDLKRARDAKALGLLKRFKTKFTTTSRQIGENATEDVETVEVEIELYDGQAARRDLGKHLGLFIERNVNVNIDLKDATDQELEEIKAGKIPARLLRGA